MALPCPFVWYDYMAEDVPSALAFYRAVFGWSAEQAGAPDRSYTILGAGGTPVGGMIALPSEAREAGAGPSWIGSIGVADVDAAVARVEAMEGGVRRVAEDIPGFGRFAVVHDPQGATFTLFQPADPARARPDTAGKAGGVGWHELYATNWDLAFGFYAELFGWTQAEAVDMGAMGTYQLFAAGGQPVGGMMNKPDTMPAAQWGYYFTVDGVDAAIARIAAAGGEVLNGPHQVPGGQWIAQARDPQGAPFAVVGQAR